MAQGAPSWLNIDFTQRILRMSEDDNTIQVVDIFTKPATAKGDNYTSDMIRVAIEYNRKQGDKQVSGKKTLLFKFEPIEEGRRKELIEKSFIFDTETSMLTDTLKKMNERLGMRLCAQVYYVRMERPLCLIMEDLAPLGYRMADRQVGLDLAHATLALQRLAMFHASSVAVCEKEPKHKDIYCKGIFNTGSEEDINMFFSCACISLANEMENWPELDKSYVEKLRKLSKTIPEKAQQVLQRSDDEFNVINHGDFWTNNMLFRYDENNKPIDHIFVDFQLSIYTSPAIDLQYFLASSVNEELREQGNQLLLNKYLESLTATMKRIGCKTQPPTMDMLLKSIKERAMFELITLMFLLPVIVVDKSEAKDMGEMLPENGVMNNPGFKHPFFRKVMVKNVPRYDKMGLLD